MPLHDVPGQPQTCLDFADSLLCGLVRCAPCRLDAELIEPAIDPEVVFHLSVPGSRRVTEEVARCRAAMFRAVLARISTVLGIPPYLGHAQRKVTLDGSVVSVVAVVSNQGQGGFWIRLWASAHLSCPSGVERSTALIRRAV